MSKNIVFDKESDIAKPEWTGRPSWRARLAAIWHVLLGRSVLFNVWICTNNDGGIAFDGSTWMVGGGIRGDGYMLLRPHDKLTGV